MDSPTAVEASLLPVAVPGIEVVDVVLPDPDEVLVAEEEDPDDVVDDESAEFEELAATGFVTF